MTIRPLVVVSLGTLHPVAFHAVEAEPRLVVMVLAESSPAIGAVMDYSVKLGIEPHDFRVIIGRTHIDYDEDKEGINRKQHGYSLESSVALLTDCLFQSQDRPFVTSEPFNENGEVRHMHMGVDDAGKVVLFVTTMRPNERIRIISFRRAADAERRQFQSLTGYFER